MIVRGASSAIVNKGRLTFVAAGRGGRSNVVEVRLV